MLSVSNAALQFNRKDKCTTSFEVCVCDPLTGSLSWDVWSSVEVFQSLMSVMRQEGWVVSKTRAQALFDELPQSELSSTSVNAGELHDN